MKHYGINPVHVLIGILFAGLAFSGCSTEHPNAGATNLPARRLTDAPLSNTIVIPANAPPSYVSNLIATTSPTELYKAYEHGLIGKGVMMQAMLMAQNKQPLDLYGRVVDQNGEPVVGARVEGGVLLNKDFVHSDGKTYYTMTDSNGCFNFVGVHGVSLGIRPAKEGYEYNSTLPSTRPADYRPDPNNPVVFTMWKLKGAEPMTHANINAYIPCDGTVTRFDLLTGKTSADGDFVVKLTRNPVDIVRGKPFNWSVTLDIPSGGLQPMQDAYPNEAPFDGYQSSITFDFPTNMVHWTSFFDFKKFYFKGRNSRIYGWLSLRVAGDFQPPPTSFSAEIYANPAGSRNLEFDRAKQIH